MGELKLIPKVLLASVLGVGGVLGFAAGVAWLEETVTGKPAAHLTLLLVAIVLLLAFCITMWRLIVVSRGFRQKATRVEQLEEELNGLKGELSDAAERGRAADEHTKRMIDNARKRLQAASAESLTVNLEKVRSQVESALEYSRIRQKWDTRQVRVLSIERRAGPGGMLLWVATLNVGRAGGAVRALGIEVASGEDSIAYGQILEVTEDSRCLAALEPYDVTDVRWAEAADVLDGLGDYIPDRWSVRLSERQPWSDVKETHLKDLHQKLTALIECVDASVSGGLSE